MGIKTAPDQKVPTGMCWFCKGKTIKTAHNPKLCLRRCNGPKRRFYLQSR